MIGDRDFALRQSRRAADDLQAAGVTVEFKIFPKTGHRFPVNTTKELLSALRFVLAE